MYRVSLFPTRDLHLSDLRVALINYICAKQTGKHLIVRVEDGDKAHNIDGKDQELLDIIALFGISYSHLYYQSDNFKYHLQFASTLLDRKKAFICFCPDEKATPYDGRCEHLSPDEVLNNPNPFVIRMKTEPISDSFVIMARNKYPTYTFACAFDDMLQGVSTIIQDEAYLENSSKEELIRHAIGYDQAISYTHLPTVHESEKSVQWLLDQGYMPEAIANYLLLLSTPTPTEIFTLEEALSWFDIATISKDSVHFDMEKLGFINREHIKKLSDMELSKRIGYACENIGKLAKLYTKEVSTTLEIKQKIDVIFAKKEPLATFEAESKLLQELIFNAPYFEMFDEFQAYLLEKSNLHDEAFFKPLHFWLSGSVQGLELALMYPLIKNYLKEIVR
ncbi:glutamate--tRNA ligase family protein [Sulfurospirillum sp. UCH001]|uniref:glutamate--tRNA ligase family protein n=1 Tax=Sulfurospirillum sp. UCH001 TaxID=1581011 RepID=UPI00082E6D5C|nr:glutamate--tRNA ligase family protein [Sulfurospirillum sp. UCH001]